MDETTKKQGGDNPVSSLEEQTAFQEKVYAIIEKIRPFLHMEGGDIEVLEFQDYDVKVRLVGACAGCPSSIYTLKLGIEQALRREIPQFGRLIPVESSAPVE